MKHLSDAGYAYATQYLEGTTIKQIVGFLVAEKRLLSGARIVLKLRKPRGTHTYCWSEAEVRAMLKYTAGIPELLWLHGILATLAYSGMRIGELIALRWTDLDFGNGKVSLVDESTAGRNKTGHVQTLKGGRGRSFPIHAELKPVLEAIPRGRDGFVFHGPAGGRLKADTVRNIFIREVLQPLAPMFPAPDGENGFADGRLHSFRHFFCSWCANAYTNLQMLQGWLGHQDSKMVNRYYHMNDGDARRQMGRLSLREEGAND